MKRSLIYLLSLFLFILNASHLFAQTLPVGLLDQTDDLIRRQQLLGNDTSRSSLMIRPLNISADNEWLMLDEDAGLSLGSLRKSVYSAHHGNHVVYVLPAILQQQFNGHHPYGWNDGAMVQAKGYQMLISGGIYARIGPLSIQFRPEYVYAENKHFTQMQDAGNNNEFLLKYAAFSNSIDLPERYGSSPYSRMKWGQSSIRLTFDPVSIGLSNENLWWGPGVRNSLLMSNNASGFKHITLNTSKPVGTPVGSFEAQIIAGRLEGSGIRVNNSLFTAKPDNWRYISGAIITYQPKWVPGLFIGFDRTFTVYKKDMGNSFGDYFPLFSSIEKASISGNVENDEDKRKRDQYASVFAKWVLPESKAEVYFQYGRNDHPYDSRDAFIEPEHSRAYVAGMRKLIPLANDNEFIQVGLEVTQLEGAKTSLAREQPAWYQHYQVRDGYTNEGQVLGAGIGPGSNLQSLDVNWVRGLKRIGLQIERRVNNNDLYYNAVKDLRRHWVDLSFGGKFDWNFNKIILNSQLTYIRSLNYQYVANNAGFGRDVFWNWDKRDVNNLQLRVGLAYIW